MVDQKLSIIHRAGKENIVADALSHSPNGKPLTKGIGEDEVQVAVISSSTADVSLLSLVPHDDPICLEWTAGILQKVH